MTSEIDETDELPSKWSARSARTKSSYNIFAYKQSSTKSIAKLAGNIVDKGIFQLQNEPQDLQCALFIIRSWDKQVDVDWLNQYVSNNFNS